MRRKPQGVRPRRPRAAYRYPQPISRRLVRLLVLRWAFILTMNEFLTDPGPEPTRPVVGLMSREDFPR